MPLNQHKLKLLWRRLEDAKLHLDHCHNDIRVIALDQYEGAMPSIDSAWAHSRALMAEELAAKSYLTALADYKAALALEPVSVEIEAGTGRNSQLTPREREVLTLIAAGQSSKQISGQLGIAFKTVVCHRYRLQKKLHARNSADLTRAALKMGLTKL